MSDLIDRQAAIDAIRASTSKYTGFMEMEMYTDDDAVEAIKALPSAQPETICIAEIKFSKEDLEELVAEKVVEIKAAQPDVPERNVGKWIKVGDNSYRCSVCGEVSCCNGNFCPDCGADMRGEDDETY